MKSIVLTTNPLKRLEMDKQLYGEEEMEFLSGLFEQVLFRPGLSKHSLGECRAATTAAVWV